MTPFRLVRLTRANIGSMGLADQEKRDRLAKELKASKQAQRDLWDLHGHPKTYRIHSEYAHAQL